MMTEPARARALDALLARHDYVLATSRVRQHLTEGQLRWQVSSGRWQRPCRGVIVAHSGGLSESQILRVAVHAAGPRSALAGLTAARLGGLTGFDDPQQPGERPVHVIAPKGASRRMAPPPVNVRMHYSRMLTGEDVHPAREPRRTRMPRSLIDGAAWMPTDRGAMAVLAAGVQQRLVRAQDLRAVLDRSGTVHRRRLMYEILADVEGGSQALSELDFTRQVIRRFCLPEPSRQAGRRDSRGRRRWIDVLFDEWKVAVEIDGAQHTTPLDQWDDMERDNDLSVDGYRLLRFPAWLVRRDPETVAAKILAALRANGYRR